MCAKSGLLYTTYMPVNNHSNIERFDKVIAKIKWCSFLASQCSFVTNAVLIRKICELLTSASADLADYTILG